MEALKNIQNERIIFSPLNWGFGHVSRSIPLLQKLLENNNELLIACDAEQQEVFTQYLEGVEFTFLEGYPFKFNGNGNFALDFLLTIRKLFSFGKKESKFLKQLADEKGITLVISDHRYFFRSDKVQSVFMTHQLNLPIPWYLKFVHRVHSRLMSKFNTIWIVDDKMNTFSGKLGDSADWKKGQEIHYIGPLSRFDKAESKDKRWTTVLVSGPEPYAEQFYKTQKKRFKEIPENVCLIYNGMCEDNSGKKEISWLEIDERLLATKKLIARSGYSTIMDAHFIGCETEWYPTQGQWEQEYLAKIHSANA